MNPLQHVLIDGQPHPLPFDNDRVAISRDEDSDTPLALRIPVLSLVFKGDGCELDVIDAPDGVTLKVDGVQLGLILSDHDTLSITTTQGDDKVRLDTRRPNPIRLDLGPGHDRVQARWLPTLDVRTEGLQSNSLFIDAGPGDDRVLAYDSRHSVIHGGEGDDTLYSTARHGQLFAGPGDDLLIAGPGRTVIVQDGEQDQVISSQGHTDIYRTGPPPAFVTAARYHTIDPTLGRNFRIVGTDTFCAQVRDHLQLLAGCETGAHLLMALDQSGAAIDIALAPSIPTTRAEGDTPGTLLADGTPGPRSRFASVFYDPRVILNNIPAVIILYHELCHVWNKVNGNQFEFSGWWELQAIGQPSRRQPYDFDGDPATPPLDTNPWPFNENALRAELGYPPRLNHQQL